MKEIAEFLAAIVGLCWVGLAGYIVYRFGPGIDRILTSVQKGKFFGQEFELGEQLDNLERQAEEAAETSAESSPADCQLTALPEGAIDNLESTASDGIAGILETAIDNPKIALLMLANLIEEELREIFFNTAIVSRAKRFSWSSAISELTQRHLLTPATGAALQMFTAVRNSMVHKIADVHDNEVSRVIDSGLKILTTLRAIPRGRYFVHQANLTVYGDPECREPYFGITGVMIESRSGGERTVVGVYPTTLDHFVAGKQVAWEWKGGTIHSRAYFVDPETDERREAWTESLEFVGRNFEET